ncbi:MAG TPA: hypothetical protein VIK18_08740, partial [Pirellulales bacterium]
RLPACYRPRAATGHPRPGNPRQPTTGNRRTGQTLPSRTVQDHRLLAADPIALAAELLIRYRARGGN